ncbi:putative sigma-54 modulation protein [Dysgonomonas macrotermitis]|uniref:Ribosome hibernation promoting factor n=2 Tax=Dysgonomonas macrotermitis TaxID=1346286 RepID=A0A1M4TAV5_9BACT|nr:putative sigma-54 modulation protein [Dysgonomonas macrotermitis]
MMNINIQSLHFDATDKLKEFIQKKVTKLEKYSDDILIAEVILKVVKPETKMNKEASIKLSVKNDDLFANKTAESFEEAIDLCAEALEKQLVKYKEKAQAK